MHGTTSLIRDARHSIVNPPCCALEQARYAALKHAAAPKLKRQWGSVAGLRRTGARPNGSLHPTSQLVAPRLTARCTPPHGSSKCMPVRTSAHVDTHRMAFQRVGDKVVGIRAHRHTCSHTCPCTLPIHMSVHKSLHMSIHKPQSWRRRYRRASRPALHRPGLHSAL